METIHSIGSTVGQYVGDGQGESATTEALMSVEIDVDDAEQGINDKSQNDEEVRSDDVHPLLMFYDCEATGFSVYNDHVTDIYVNARLLLCEFILSIYCAVKFMGIMRDLYIQCTD